MTIRIALLILYAYLACGQTVSPPSGGGGGGGGTVGGLTPGCIPQAVTGNSLTQDSPACVDPVTGQIISSVSMVLPIVEVEYAASLDFDLATATTFVVGELTGNVSATNFTNLKPNYSGKLIFKQDGTGGRTVSLPSGFCTVTAAAGVTTTIPFSVGADGATLTSANCTDTTTPTQIAGPTRSGDTSTAAGQGKLTFRNNTIEYYANNSPDRHIMPLCSGSTDQCLSSDILSDAATLKTGEIEAQWYGSSVIATGAYGWVRIPVAITLESFELICLPSGSIVIDIWLSDFANFPPVVGGTITASAKPTLSNTDKAQDLTLTGWTTSIPAGSYLRFNVDSASTVTTCTMALKYTVN